MEYVVGATLGIVVGISTSLVGMDRDRALYPAILVVVASYYALFAVMGGSNEALIIECAFGFIFVALAFVGFRTTLWLTAAGLIAHGIFDILRIGLSHNPGVPEYWPGFCSSIDVVMGGYLAWLLYRDRHSTLAAVPRNQR